MAMIMTTISSMFSNMLSRYSLPLKIVLMVVFALISAYFGWSMRGWKEESVRLQEKQAIILQHKAEMKQQQDTATHLEQQLSQLKQKEKVVVRETYKVVERPVYRNVCLDDDGLRLIEQARSNTSKGDSSIPASEVR